MFARETTETAELNAKSPKSVEVEKSDTREEEKASFTNHRTFT